MKDANFCQITGRDETLSSTFSTARSGLVEEINANAMETFATDKRSLRGNSKVTSGPYGSRKRKSDGAEYDESKGRGQKTIKGTLRSKETLKFVCERHEQIAKTLRDVDNKQEMWNSLQKELIQKDNQFMEHRVAVKVEQFDANYHRNKPQNKWQKHRAGEIDVMPILEGKVPYTKLNKSRDTEQIKKELEFRNLSTDGPWRDGLIKRLKEHEGDTKNFIPRCPDVEFSFVWEG